MIRNYVMERFLERISLSKYRKNFILKGGMLVSAMVGIDIRSTLDIDATVKKLPLEIETAKDIIEEIIIIIAIDDGITFTIKNASEIMDEAEYSGIRINLEAQLESMRTPIKVDISTGDAITPQVISYTFQLMFEERTISQNPAHLKFACGKGAGFLAILLYRLLTAQQMCSCRLNCYTDL